MTNSSDLPAPGPGAASVEPAILVAYDGSPDARLGLDWALREARALACGLRIVYVSHHGVALDGAPGAISWSPALVAAVTEAGPPVLAEALAIAEQAGVPATTMLLSGPPAAVIAEQSRSARLVVIGSRGMGVLRGTLLGSIVPHAASHSHAPVIVVRAGGAGTGPVVVGVDGSQESRETLKWAFEHAGRHGLALEVLLAYDVPVYPEVVPYVPPVEVIEEVAQAADQMVTTEAENLSAAHPQVTVTARSVRDRASHALIAASEYASMVVVGSHGRGGFTGMLLGSTSQSLLHHSHCTVAVIRHEEAGKAPV